MSSEESIITSCGNVFADLGLENSEELLVKAELIRKIYIIVINEKISDTELANILKIELAQVIDLMSGKLGEFSAPQLFQFLNALDQDVEIVVRPKSQSKARTCVIAS